MRPGCVLSCWAVSLLYLCLAGTSGAALNSREILGQDLDLGEPYNPLDELPLSAAWLTQYLRPMPAAQKRRPISINQDLMSISRMLGGSSRQGDTARAQSFLDSIGKRADPGNEQLQQLGGGFVSGLQQPGAAFQYSPSTSTDFVRARRAGQLSVGMPLRTLSGMIQAQRRRQFVDKANSAHSRLMGIGKRSVGSEPEDQDTHPALS